MWSATIVPWATSPPLVARTSSTCLDQRWSCMWWTSQSPWSGSTDGWKRRRYHWTRTWKPARWQTTCMLWSVLPVKNQLWTHGLVESSRLVPMASIAEQRRRWRLRWKACTLTEGSRMGIQQWAWLCRMSRAWKQGWGSKQAPPLARLFWSLTKTVTFSPPGRLRPCETSLHDRTVAWTLSSRRDSWEKGEDASTQRSECIAKAELLLPPVITGTLSWSPTVHLFQTLGMAIFGRFSVPHSSNLFLSLLLFPFFYSFSIFFLAMCISVLMQSLFFCSLSWIISICLGKYESSTSSFFIFKHSFSKFFFFFHQTRYNAYRLCVAG